MKRRRPCARTAVAVLVALCCVAGPAVDAVAQAPDDGSVDALQREITELEQQVRQTGLQRERATTERDRLTAELADLTAAIADARTAVAQATSAVATTRVRVGGMARVLYRRPMADVMPALQSRDLNEFIVSRHYLTLTVARDSDALGELEAAQSAESVRREDLTRLEGELRSAQARNVQLGRVLDGTQAEQERRIGELQQLIEKARAVTPLSVPFPLLPDCVAAPRTNLAPPYTLEDWAVWTLKSVARRTGTPPEDVVTTEKIKALIAFAWGEGGGIKGHKGWFNPLNTNGWTRLFPELGGRKSGFGTDDWPTFDAGVEASARALTWKTQNRLGQVLVRRDATMADFFEALASHERYTGNFNWSENDKFHVPKYLSLQSRLNTQYERYAGEVMRAYDQVVTGTPRAPTGMSAPGSPEFLGAPLTC